MNSELEKWGKDLKKYLEFYAACLLNSYEYGGNKIHKTDIPHFKEFADRLKSPTYNLCKPFFAIDYYLENGRVKRTFENRLNDDKPFNNNTIYRETYSWFRGVRWNVQFKHFPYFEHIKDAHS